MEGPRLTKAALYRDHRLMPLDGQVELEGARRQPAHVIVALLRRIGGKAIPHVDRPGKPYPSRHTSSRKAVPPDHRLPLRPCGVDSTARRLSGDARRQATVSDVTGSWAH